MSGVRDLAADGANSAPAESQFGNSSGRLWMAGGSLAAPLVAALVGTYLEHAALSLIVNCVLAFSVGRAGSHWGPAVLAGLAGLGALGPLWVMHQRPTGAQIESAVAGAILIWLAGWIGLRERRLRQASRRNATTDALTGLLNQDGFMERLDGEINRARRHNTTFAVAFLDSDRFKELNDQQGHLAGDRFLCEAAQATLAAVRNYDSVARWGGDEFTILFPDCGPVAATTAATRVQLQLNRLAEREGNRVTWSMGIVIADGHCDPQEVVRAADELMYEAKRSAPGSLVMKELKLDRPRNLGPP